MMQSLSGFIGSKVLTFSSMEGWDVLSSANFIGESRKREAEEEET